MPYRPLFLSLFVAVALVGCGSSAPVSLDADTDLVEARAAVERARAVGAEEEAPAELRAATSRLMQAEAALADGDAERAARISREATIDARLAEATVLASRARTRASLADELRALRAALASLVAQ